MRKVFLYIFLCFLSSFGWGDVLEHVKPAVWKVQGSFGQHGSGFFIGPNQFVTNFHVIRGILKRHYDLRKISLIQDKHTPPIRIRRVIALSALYDIALIETEQEVSEDYLVLRNQSVQTSESLFLLGYPSWGKLKTVESVGPGTWTTKDMYYFFVNYRNLRGFSGGPVVDGQGTLVGVHFQTIGNMSVMMSVQRLKNIIDGVEGSRCLNLKSCIEQEMQELVKQAENGNELAQYELKDNKEIAWSQRVHWLEQSALRGMTFAMYSVGIKYLKPGFVYRLHKAMGLEESSRKYYTKIKRQIAFKLLRKAADQGLAPAQYAVARQLYLSRNGKDDEKRVRIAEWLKQSADQQYAPAEYVFGSMIYKGQLVPKDQDVAMKYWQRAQVHGFSMGRDRLRFEEVKNECKQMFRRLFRLE